MSGFETVWITIQGWLFETFVQPVLYAVGMAMWAEPAFDAVEFVMMGVIQIVVIAAVMMPLERWRPVERWPDNRRRRVDFVYTGLNKLGFVPLLVFALLTPLDQWLSEEMRAFDLAPIVLEQVIPGLAERPFLTFLVYFVVLDFAGYWVHRAQHAFRWWWALHALHHSQRQMTCWSDDRNHVLDDLIVGVVLAVVALAIGVEPGQFVAITVVSRLIEALSHANLAQGFGRFGRYLLVDPWFHRRHHALADGADPGRHDVNYGVVLPIWDVLFGTARFGGPVYPTGVDNAEVDRDGAGGFFGQQVHGITRVLRALRGSPTPNSLPRGVP